MSSNEGIGEQLDLFGKINVAVKRGNLLRHAAQGLRDNRFEVEQDVEEKYRVTYKGRVLVDALPDVVVANMVQVKFKGLCSHLSDEFESEASGAIKMLVEEANLEQRDTGKTTYPASNGSM